jgi:hypothetical protein
MLSSCGYDTETKELTVTFNGGKTYIYVNENKSIYDGLINAESAGKYFNVVKSDLVQK